MKRNIIIAILGLTMVFATSSFRNAGSEISSGNITQTGSISAPLDGRWAGYYSNSIGTAYYFYALTFNTDGSLLVEANGSVGYGTWSMSGDQVFATYTMDDIEPAMRSESDGDTYSLSGNVSGNVINGSLSGTGGNFIFSVTKE